MARFFALVLAIGLSGCADPPPAAEPRTTPPAPVPEPTVPPEPTTPTPTTPSDSGTEPPVVDCTSSCAKTSPGAPWARCYACRCKAAMDGWLPSPEELQCSLGAEMVVYRAQSDGTLVAVDDDVDQCANPSLLYGTCAPGGRLGQLTHDDVTVKWICRQNRYKPGAATDPTLRYDDVGAILTNARTGATCFFDDSDGTGIAGDNWPQMDLDASDGDPTAFEKLFYNADGRGCTGCHDDDPFNYTPQLQSVGWVTGDYVWSDYSYVTLGEALVPVSHAYLVSPEVAPCTTCHRITSTSSCSSWVPDSLGVSKGGGIQPEVAAAGGDPADPLWPVAVWMPFDGAGDPDDWDTTYGEAARTILGCCQRPGIDTAATPDHPACVWEQH